MGIRSCIIAIPGHWQWWIGGRRWALSARRIEQGKRVHVLVDETRPRLQGARLTAWELEQYGIPYEIISDNMAGYFLQSGQAQKVLFGADGSLPMAIWPIKSVLICWHWRHDNGIPVYSVAPISTIDLSLATWRFDPHRRAGPGRSSGDPISWRACGSERGQGTEPGF